MTIWMVTLAKDIGLLVVNIQNKCSLNTGNGRSGYVDIDLETWMYIAGIVHIVVLLFIFWMAVEELFERHCLNDNGRAVLFVLMLCCWLSLFAWTIIGFLMEKEIRNYGVNNQQCRVVMLCWLILEMLLEYGPFALVICINAIRLERKWMEVYNE